MKKLFYLLICAFFILNVNAQQTGDFLGTVSIGYSPLGNLNAVIIGDDAKFKYNYKAGWGVNVDYNTRFNNGFDMLTELNYWKGKLDSYKPDGSIEKFNPTPSENLSYFSFNVYYGRSLALNRFVIQGVIGPGFSYLNGGPIHNLCLSPAAKARVVGYITPKIGMYVGANGRYNIGFKKPGILSVFQWNIEAGIVFNIGAANVLQYKNQKHKPL